MTTARAIVGGAIRKINAVGEGQPIPPEVAQNCLACLNDMIDAWAIESLFATSIQTYTASVTSQTVTIGPTGDIVVPNVPTRLENVFVRAGNLDFGIDLVTYSQFSDIALKSVTGPWPSKAYYDRAGTLYLYPAGNASEIHVGILQRLSEFATLDTDYAVGQGTRRAMILSLAEEIAPEMSVAVPPNLMQLAFRARRMLKRSNHVVPQLDGISTNNQIYTGFIGGGSGSSSSTAYDGIDGGSP
jgi:hypothetical protein